MPREHIATWPQTRANRLNTKSLEALSGTRVITLDEIETYNAMIFDANGGARNLDLPAVGACAGVYLYLTNKTGAANSITVRDAAAATVVTLAQNKSALVWSDGVTWQSILSA